MQKLNKTNLLHLAGLLVIGTCATFIHSTPTHAEYLGLPSGRSANIPALPTTSVEAGFVTGEVGEASYRSIGARFNFRPSDGLMAYFDVAHVKVERHDGLGYGAGFFYHVPGITKTSHLAFKVSYHAASLKRSGEPDRDGNVLAVEGLLSGQQIGESNLRWYANFGVHKFDFDAYDDTELGFGGGVFSETSFGELYGGIDFIDEITFGVGIRFHL